MKTRFTCSKALPSFNERDSALLSIIASGAGDEGHTSPYLFLRRVANIWGSLTIRHLWARLESVIGFFSLGVVLLPTTVNEPYSRCFSD